MKSLIILIVILDLLFVSASFSRNQIKDPVAHWKFEKIDTVINESPSKFREGIVIDRVCYV
jgi:hypothetical protein